VILSFLNYTATCPGNTSLFRMPATHSRILYIDAYDSFANNIVALLQTSVHAAVEIIKHNDPRFINSSPSLFWSFLDLFHAVVVGPGPGDPRNDADTGIIPLLWSLPDEHQLPVLGICLGFQSMCRAFGGSVSLTDLNQYTMSLNSY
jgi:para-aminobenzoate synthetase